jgi:hypothetical protein
MDELTKTMVQTKGIIEFQDDICEVLDGVETGTNNKESKKKKERK